MSEGSPVPTGLATPEFVHELLDRAADVVTVVDADGRIVYVNRTVVDVLDWSPDELAGVTALSLVHPDDMAQAADALEQVLADPRSMSTVEVRIRAAHGDYLWFDVLTSGWIDASEVRGVVLNLRESTGRKEREAVAAHRARLDRLVSDVFRQALDATLDDVRAALPGMLAQLGRLLGAAQAYVANVDGTGAAELVAAWSAPGRGADVEPVPAAPAGVEWSGGVVDGDALFPLVVSGRLLAVLGVRRPADARDWNHDEITTLRAITEALAVAMARERDRRALAESETRFRLLAENTTDVITLTDQDGRCRYMSPAAREVLGIDPTTFVGQPLFDWIHPDDLDGVLARAALLGDGEESMLLTCRCVTPDGRIVWMENSLRTVRDGATGEITGFQSTSRDVTDRKALEQELSRLALHDALTGVANRALFVDRLTNAIHRRRRTGAAFAVLEIDLDGFKEVNDRFGHHAGDHTLVTVAHRLADAVRHTDTVARVGGDEFTVLCSDSDADDAHHLAERLVAAVAEPIPIGGATVTVGASIGVAPADRGDPSLDELLRAADDAMYDAKRSGKACVRVKRPDGSGGVGRR